MEPHYFWYSESQRLAKNRSRQSINSSPKIWHVATPEGKLEEYTMCSTQQDAGPNFNDARFICCTSIKDIVVDSVAQSPWAQECLDKYRAEFKVFYDKLKAVEQRGHT